MQVVHVIGPFPGQRYQHTFADAATPDQILFQLSRPDVKRTMGRVGTQTKKDDKLGMVVPHPDPETPWLIDDPRTVVCIGDITADNQFVETKRLKGPAATPPKPAGG